MAIIDLDRAMGRRNGLISELYPVEIPRGEPQIWAYAAQRGALPWEVEEDEEGRIGSGCAFHQVLALAGCVGEIAERYGSSFVEGPLETGNYRDLCDRGLDAVDPAEFSLFGKNQLARPDFPFSHLSPDQSVEWEEVDDLVTGKTRWLPAFHLHFPYPPGLARPPFPLTTTGLAAARTPEEARTRGICEIVERDALANIWLGRLSPPRFTLPSSDQFQHLRQTFLVDHLEYHFFDLTSDFQLPVVAALSFGPSVRGPVAALGVAAHLSPQAALTKALLENSQARLSVIHRRRRGLDKTYRRDFADVLSFSDHSMVYSAHPEARRHLDFLWRGREVPWPWEDEEEPMDLVSPFRDRGYRLYSRELTTPDVAELGFAVVRVVSPDLTLLHGSHPYPFLGSPRLYRPDRVFSWASGESRTEEELERAPPHMLG